MGAEQLCVSSGFVLSTLVLNIQAVQSLERRRGKPRWLGLTQDLQNVLAVIV